MENACFHFARLSVHFLIVCTSPVNCCYPFCFNIAHHSSIHFFRSLFLYVFPFVFTFVILFFVGSSLSSSLFRQSTPALRSFTGAFPPATRRSLRARPVEALLICPSRRLHLLLRHFSPANLNYCFNPPGVLLNCVLLLWHIEHCSTVYCVLHVCALPLC